MILRKFYSKILISIFFVASFSTSINGANLISEGLYKEPLQNSIFYESFVPLIYEYKVPEYDAELDVTLRDWRTQCQTDGFSPSYTCPVFFHLEKFIEKFARDIVVKPLRPISNRIPIWGSIKSKEPLNGICELIEPHFAATKTDDIEFKRYIEGLKGCENGDGTKIISSESFGYKIKDIYKTMITNFENEFSKNIGDGMNSLTNKIGPASYVNALTIHQGLMMFNYWIEKMRLVNSENICQSSLIPQLLIKSENLTEALSQISVEMNKKELRLSLKPEMVYQYFSLPIADCTYVKKRASLMSTPPSFANSFIVRLLVPVMNKVNNFETFCLRSIPFVYKEKLRDANNKTILKVCEVPSEVTDKSYIYDSVHGIILESKCEGGELCKIPGIEDRPLIHPCVEEFFTSSLSKYKEHCALKCTIIDEKDKFAPKLPIFRSLPPNKFIIAGKSDLGVVLKCANERDVIVKTREVGAVEVTLACHCYLLHNSFTFRPRNDFCKKSIYPTLFNSYTENPPLTTITNWIFPIHFLSMESLGNLTVNGSFDLEMFENLALSLQYYEGEKRDLSSSLDFKLLKSWSGGAVEILDDYLDKGGHGAGIWIFTLFHFFIFLLFICAIALFGLKLMRKDAGVRIRWRFWTERNMYKIQSNQSTVNIISNETIPHQDPVEYVYPSVHV